MVGRSSMNRRFSIMTKLTFLDKILNCRCSLYVSIVRVPRTVASGLDKSILSLNPRNLFISNRLYLSQFLRVLGLNFRWFRLSVLLPSNSLCMLDRVVNLRFLQDLL